MKFDCSNKFDSCYYGQVDTFRGNIYFAGDGINANTKMEYSFGFRCFILGVDSKKFFIFHVGLEVACQWTVMLLQSGTTLAVSRGSLTQ